MDGVFCGCSVDLLVRESDDKKHFGQDDDTYLAWAFLLASVSWNYSFLSAVFAFRLYDRWKIHRKEMTAQQVAGRRERGRRVVFRIDDHYFRKNDLEVKTELKVRYLADATRLLKVNLVGTERTELRDLGSLFMQWIVVGVLQLRLLCQEPGAGPHLLRHSVPMAPRRPRPFHLTLPFFTVSLVHEILAIQDPQLP